MRVLSLGRLVAVARAVRHLTLIAAFGVAAGGVPSWGQDCLEWAERNGTGPSPRECHAMTYDDERGLVVLFGGWGGSGGFLDDTWEWDGSAWVLQEASPHPAARQCHAMAYDSARQVTVLFGGRTNLGEGCWYGDTWEFDGATWEPRTYSGSSPQARAGHAMAYDAACGVVVLFGGLWFTTGGEPMLLNDTWVWNGTAWAILEGSYPPAREGHAMVYDSRREVVVLFGGRLSWAGDEVGDTWEWSGEWTLRSTSGPTPRGYHAMAYDAERGVTVLFGGFNSGGAYFNDTWEWDGNTWTARILATAPPVRFFHSVAFDGARQSTVLFGGRPDGGGFYGDIWELEALLRIAQPPTGQTVTVGQPIVFSVQAECASEYSYQWRREGEELTDGGRISGAQTDTLTIDPVLLPDAGTFDVMVTSDCGSVTSAPAELVVTTLVGDLNCDGAVNVFDIDPFVLALTYPPAYTAAYPDCDVWLADCDGDGWITAFDIDPFVLLLTGG